jgi:cold shock CspA family protein
LNARAKRLFEEARKKNPDLKMPSETASATELSEEDLALIKQGVGDKSSRSGGQGSADGGAGDGPREQIGSVVTYFEAKGFGFLRPDDGGRDVFFHVSRLAEGDPTTLKQHDAERSQCNLCCFLGLVQKTLPFRAPGRLLQGSFI